MQKTIITAHTGCMNTPPNTTESVLAGIKAGAEILEVDIRSTKDGKVVLFHDKEIMTRQGLLRVQDVTYQELVESIHGKMTLLEDVLPLIKENNRMINLDVKEDKAIDPLIQTVERHQMREYTILSGCEKERAAYVKKYYRPYQVLLNASYQLYQEVHGDYSLFVEQTLKDAIESSCCGININYQLCSRELVQRALLRFLPVCVWTVDEPEEMKKMVELGVYSITSNEVETLRQLVDDRLVNQFQ